MRRKAIDPDRVRAAIEAAERHTSAEIVVSVAPFFVGDVERAAHRAFARLGVARTRARNGVLVFVVPSRHELVVLPDEGIEGVVEASLWSRVASNVAAAFARGDGTAGLVEGIAELGIELASVFPRRPDDVNELPDRPQT